MNKLWSSPLAVLVAAIVVVVPAVAPDRKPPRIVGVAMLDVNGNARADRVRLTYSERIRHRRDADGRYPFAVAGYRVLAVGAASGKTLVLVLREKAASDSKARPSVRYGRTVSQPVTDRAGLQALGQLFRAVRAHGHVPAPGPVTAPPSPPPPPSPSPSPPTTPAAMDSDRDGIEDRRDCAPTNAAIHPGAADTPDLDFVDSNCDGIDGTEADAIFVSPNGNDADPGTKAKPMRQIQAAVTAAAGKDRYVLVAFGSYGHVTVASGVGIFGGYDPVTWVRQSRYPDGLPLITGRPEGVLAAGAKDVVLQHLEIRGLHLEESEPSAYGIRALLGSSLTLQRVVARADDGFGRVPAANGAAGPKGGNGGIGFGGGCDSGSAAPGGAGGSSPAGRPGGAGGYGGGSNIAGGESAGFPGKEGLIGTFGGNGGKNGNPGKPGARGFSGENGVPGSAGAGGTNLVTGATVVWIGQKGANGGAGQPGNGGGGGGGGGGQTGAFVRDGTGNGGGGGGGGAGGGTGGAGGSAGGGSFGVYLHNSSAVVQASSIAAGNGAPGRNGGEGGFGGAGGVGGFGAGVCTTEIGAGGNGGFGGVGGRGGGGGGGAGGPSVGIFKVGASTATVEAGSTVTFRVAGPGGVGGGGGPGGTGGRGAAGIAQAIYP